MFGLEGSGFIISLGVTLLLCGIIAYYVKSQFAVLDHKVSSMFQLVSALTGEVNKHDSWLTQVNSQNHATERDNTHELQAGGKVDNRVQVSDSEVSDTETEISDTESEDNINNNAEDVHLSGIQHLTMGSELANNVGDGNDEVKIVELQMDNIEELHLDDNEIENHNEVDEHESESEDISDTEDDSESMITQPETLMVEPEENVEVIKLENDTKVVSQVEAQVDYKKLQVKALRQLVKERGLSGNPSKINKKDLVKLLQA